MTTPTQPPQSPAVPEGWVLVPRRPTAEMLGATIQRGPLNRTWSLGLVGYQEMLNAAPPPSPTASVDVGALRELVREFRQLAKSACYSDEADLAWEGAADMLESELESILAQQPAPAKGASNG